ncbi:MAG: TonB family protein [Burkholderiaceae bacterium]|jgi:protein TonB|nr:TonB family protein [Burkholderiaceae bacterium]MDH5209616.1 TonB family protein [Burkholderiaceae bacterium]
MDVAEEPRSLKALLADKVLVMALTVSIGLHMTILAIRFVDPELLRVRSSDPPLDIILVNAKSETRPGKPAALAQANLDGGGAHERGRRTSPLPNSFEMRDGDALEEARRSVQQLEEEQRRLLASLKESLQMRPSPRKETAADDPQSGSLDEETRQRLARAQAEIAKQISDYEKRPRKHHYMPSTSEYRYARYFEDWRARVEKVGNENYPAEARGRYYGSLRLTVSIRKDGSVADTILEKSSGSAVLDRAARRIVQLAGPYPPFPPDIARDTDILEITRTWIFTNDQLATRSADAARP